MSSIGPNYQSPINQYSPVNSQGPSQGVQGRVAHGSPMQASKSVLPPPPSYEQTMTNDRLEREGIGRSNKKEIENEHIGRSESQRAGRGSISDQIRSNLHSIGNKMKSKSGKSRLAIASSDIDVAKHISRLEEALMVGILRGL